MSPRLTGLVVCSLVALALLGCSEPQPVSGKPFHHTNAGFRNPPGSPERNSWFARQRGAERAVNVKAEAATAIDHVLPRVQVLRGMKETEGRDTVT